MKDESIVKRIACPGAPEQQLAVITSNSAASTPHVLFCSGFHSSMRGLKCEALSEHAAENGYRFSRFDYRGHGESDGKAIDCTLEHWLEDTLAVIDSTVGPLTLVGSSMGGWLATHAALSRPDRVSSLLLIAAAPDFLTELIESQLDHQQRWQLENGETIFLPSEFEEPPRPVTQALLDSGHRLALLGGDKLSTLKMPIRMIHGTEDTDVPWQFSERLMQGLGGEASLTLLHGADHRLSDDKSLALIKRELLDLIKAS